MMLVDTSSWIQCLRRDGEAEMKEKVRSLLLNGAAVLCPVDIAELWMGADSKKDQVDLTDLSVHFALLASVGPRELQFPQVI